MSRTLPLLTLSLGLFLVACDLDVPDLNNPSIDDLTDNPTREAVVRGCTGLLIGQRGNMAAPNGYVSQLGILGRESYNFDVADPRYIDELLERPLAKGSPFGGNFWAGPYANLRLGTLVKAGADSAEGFTDAERAGIRAFVETTAALDLLRVITTHDTNGAVIAFSENFDDVTPIVSREQTYADIARRLDEAATSLDNAGDSFPFPLPSGFTGFDTPQTFKRFNRAIRARVAAYTGDYATVLSALPGSFIDDTADSVTDLEVGVYYTYSTGTGDTANGLNNPNIFAHPSLTADAQMNGANPDARLLRKLRTVSPPGGAQMLSSDKKFTMYTATARVPIIRNEELILLRAEANLKKAAPDLAAVVADLDKIRAVSGGLAALDPASTAAALETELLYNRRYSLMFEGGHRLIDARRFDRIMELPIDRMGDPAADPPVTPDVRNIRYPIPQAECDARPDDEPACALGSM